MCSKGWFPAPDDRCMGAVAALLRGIHVHMTIGSRRLLAKNRLCTHDPVLSANARECQGKYSSLDRKRGTFLAFQPLSAMRDARLCCLAPCPWVLAIVPSRQLHLHLVATTPISL